MTDPDRSRLELRPPEEERLRALRSQRRSAIPRGCLWWSTWLVVGAGIWVAGILIVASVLAAPRAAQESVVDLRSADHGYRDGGSLPSVALGQLGAPQTAGTQGYPMYSGDIPGRGAPPPAGTTTGTASWFAARGYQGAVPWWRAGQSPVWATLSRFADGKTYSVTLLITGFCQCLAGQPGERLIDLSPAAFRSLGASLSVGLIRVTMEVPVQGAVLPATDTEPVQ